MSQRFLSAVLLVCCQLAAANLYARDLPDFTRLVKANSPAVVNISSQLPFPDLPLSLQDKPQSPETDALFDELMRQLLEEGGGTNPFNFDGKAHGSGFVYSADGYIVTNHHVVLDIDKREYLATFADTCLGRHLGLRTDYCATHNLTVLLVNCYHRQGHSRG